MENTTTEKKPEVAPEGALPEGETAPVETGEEDSERILETNWTEVVETFEDLKL